MAKNASSERRKTAQSTARANVMSRLKRMHIVADELRCDPIITNADLDLHMLEILNLIEEVQRRVPGVYREFP